jgi:LacI family gluconate utilization system Gnt-I transcriptional repressor
MTRKTTIGIKEIGQAVGVSMMTVSRALRGVEGVSAQMRAEILRAAKALDYRPNRNARSLATANSALIGISLPNLFSDVFPEILDGMRATFSHAGFDTVIDTTDYDPTREAAWVERMLDWNAAGLVLSGVDHAPELRQRLRDLKVPTLEIWDVSDDPIDICVGVDHVVAGLELGAHLLACGYRRPAFVGVPEGRDRRADKRLAGLRDACASAGIDDIAVERVDLRSSFEAGMLGTVRLLDRELPLPDVICYLNDHLAFGGMAACERQGLSVPADIGVAGFNGLEINKVLPRPITTLVTPRRKMGMVGARNLVARINGARIERRVAIPAELFEGGTTSHRRLAGEPSGTRVA